MALFSRKPKIEEAKAAPAVAPVVSAKTPARAVSSSHRSSADALIAPRITEKGAYLAEGGCYVFNVRTGANKREIALAIKEVFNVEPRLVRVLAVPRKQRQTRGTNRMGMTAGGKKAYVYLKKGDKIDLA